MNIPPYVADILSQPEALGAAIDQYQPGPLAGIRSRLERGEFRRILLTGMGASLTGAYPAWLQLAQLDLPVQLIDTSELIHYVPNQLAPGTLLFVISQSGRSAEILTLLDRIQSLPGLTAVGVTNHMDSPTAMRTQVVLPINSGAEYTVSTRSYLNTLAVLQMAVTQLTGGNLERVKADLHDTTGQVAAYLSGWQHRVAELKERVGVPEKMLLLGRGPSVAAVTTGALILKEAAKFTSEGISAAEFRHGPLELSDPSLTLLIFPGLEHTAHLNRGLGLEVQGYGGRVFWLASQPDPDLPTLPLPGVPAPGLPLVEILPLQLLSVALAELRGWVPGQFRHSGKVTEKE